MKIVSVIIPTFNRADMIARAIDSVLAQSYDAIEVVVVDDGSTDDTRVIVNEIGARSQRTLIYEYKENGGCASARNRGLVLASGELIAFLDSDDEWLPDAVQNMVSVLDTADTDFVYSPSIDRFEDGSRKQVNPVAAGRPVDLARKHFLRPGLRNGAYLARAEALGKVGGFDETLRHNEDSDLLQKLAIQCVASYCDAPTVIVSIHPGGKSQNRVAMAHAMLCSAERVLATHPTFTRGMGRRAQLRVSQLRRNLIEELIIADKLDDARQAASEDGPVNGLAAGLALKIGSAHPVVWKRKMQQYGRGLRRRYNVIRGSS